MALAFFRRVTILRSVVRSNFSFQCTNISSSRVSAFLIHHDRGYSVIDRLQLSPLFPKTEDDGNMKDFKIELVDDETWNLSLGLADAWRGKNTDKELRMRSDVGDTEDAYDGGNGVVSSVGLNKEDLEFDEIEDLRIRGNLFYKIDKDSKEYQEYKFDFHRRRRSEANEKERKISMENKKKENSSAGQGSETSKKDQAKEIRKSKERRATGSDRNSNLISRHHEVGDACLGKKQRTPTFNQQTAPYHEPFCLDIHISKGSVRASIIHRATSKVVAVSHSISKDMKFDLASTKNRSACAAVGEVLARRALADDIHNAVYTPRKGERLEGKLHIVLKSIIDGGVDVKVKLKQRKLKRARNLQLRAQDCGVN